MGSLVLAASIKWGKQSCSSLSGCPMLAFVLETTRHSTVIINNRENDTRAIIIQSNGGERRCI